jgi:hypothetical protein
MVAPINLFEEHLGFWVCTRPVTGVAASSASGALRSLQWVKCSGLALTGCEAVAFEVHWSAMLTDVIRELECPMLGKLG